jgi:hypothetical protein
MAPAIVEIDESNGAVEVLTHGMVTAHYGSTDTVNLSPAAAPLTPGQNSYEKAHRWHVTAMGGAVSVRAFRFYGTAPAANATHYFNGALDQATYDSANHKITAYAVVATTPTRTPEVVPQAAPASANIGVSGILAGELTAPGQSDYLYSQIRTTASAISGTVMTNTYRYEEVG